MKNSKVAILLSLVGLLTSCGKNVQTNWAKYKTDASSINLKSDKYANFDTSFNYNEFTTSMGKALLDLQNEESREVVAKSCNEMIVLQNDLSLKYQFLQTEYFGNPSDENYQAYKKAREQLNNFSEFYYIYLVKASECNDSIKKLIFGNKTDAEIKAYLESMRTSSDILALQNQIDDASNQGQLYSSQFSNGELAEYEYFSKMLELLITISKAEHKLESKLHVDDYLNYLYKNEYRRPYERDEVNKLRSYVSNYAVNYLETYQIPDSLKVMDASNMAFALSIDSVTFCNRTFYTADALDRHAKRMGGTFLNNYNHLWNDGYYYFSNNSNCLGTASTSFPLSKLNDSILFFGNRYQSAMTVEHEFGHYNALRLNESNRSQSYDVLETHSQGNEFLFLDTLVKTFENSRYRLGSYYYADIYYFHRVSTLINLISTSLVENYVFDNYNLSFDELTNGVHSILSSLGNYCSPTYWAYGSVCQPGYYISYATSLISAMEIGCQAANNFDYAKTNYENLVNYSGSSTDFYSKMNSWNLHSPFSEEAFKYVFSNIPVYK